MRDMIKLNFSTGIGSSPDMGIVPIGRIDVDKCMSGLMKVQVAGFCCSISVFRFLSK